MQETKMKRIISLVFWATILSLECKSVKIDNNGAYHLTVAIDESTAQNEIDNYIGHIQVI